MAPDTRDTMHQCSGGGPLAMVTPLHTFDTSHTSHSRLSGADPEESLAAAVGLSSHAGQLGHGADLQPPAGSTPDPSDPSQHLPPHFADPSDQAQFESDKRQIYK